MSWQYKHSPSSLVATIGNTSANSNQTTQISTSDTKQMNDDIKMSNNSSRVIDTNINQGAGVQPASDSDRNKPPGETGPDLGAVSVSTPNLIESTRQKQDREFFRRFLQPSASRDNMDEQTRRKDELCAVKGGQFRANNLAGNQTTTPAPAPVSSRANRSTSNSIMTNLPNQMNHSTPSWAPTYALPLMYSTFGGNNYQQVDNDATLMGSGVLGFQSNPSSSSSSSSLFYNGLSLGNRNSGDSSDRPLHEVGVESLLDRHNNHLLPNNSPLFAGKFSGFHGDQKKAPSNPYQRDLEPSASGRAYPGVLNNPAVLGSSSIFDVHRQAIASSSDGGGGSGDADGGANDNNNSDLMSNLNNPSHRVSGTNEQHQCFNSNQTRLLSEFLWGSNPPQQHPYQMMNSMQYPQTSAIGGPSIRVGGTSLAPSRQLGGGSHRAPGNDRANSMVANSMPPRRRNKLPSFSGEGQSSCYKPDVYGSPVAGADGSGERFSRKVFVGGLPPDIDEEEIKASFRRFGTLVVDWPHKAESKSYFPPKGYAFLLFQEEASVQALIDSCFQEEDKLYLCVSSPTIKDKPVQIRPWRLSDTDYVLDSTLALDPRKTVFVGGVPRPLKASELANIMHNLYGGVCYAGIDTDPDLKYPKGAGRVAFSNHQSYIAAISARFVHIHHSELEKRVEVKPYVLDDQFCDECQGTRCGNKFAPFFCANITCLRYYCDNCWSSVHSQAGREFHKPLVKEGGDRPRGAQPFRW